MALHLLCLRRCDVRSVDDIERYVIMGDTWPGSGSEGRPEKWAKENKNGVPVIILSVFFVMGALPIVTGMDLTLISNMGVGTDMLTEFMVLLAC